MSLGQVDYGLYGVIGGLASFVTFFNSLLAGSVGRFYAYSVGAAKKEGNEAEGLEECRRWFNVALFVHTMVPLILLVIGYPTGLWMIRHFLTIPPEKITACVWVWRFVCVSCFVGMINVPFGGMYSAKQEIAELTIYSFASTGASVCFLYYMVTHPSEWLVRYALGLCLISITPQLIIAWRACVKYPECRFNWYYLWDPARLKELAVYAGGRFLCAISLMMSSQGMSILVNKFLGPARNAAMTIGTSVSNHSTTLSMSCAHAFWPAITNAAGEGRLDYMRELVYRTCKFSTVLVLIFAIPLVIEIDEVMRLWLKTPPVDSASFCVCLLVSAVLERVVDGHWMAILGLGKIMAFQTVESLCWLGLTIVAGVVLYFGGGLIGVGISYIAGRATIIGVKLYYGAKLAGLSPVYWVEKIFMPIVFLTLVTSVFAVIPRLVMERSLVRVVTTSLVSCSVFAVLSWFLIFDAELRLFVKNKFQGVMRCRH